MTIRFDQASCSNRQRPLSFCTTNCDSTGRDTFATHTSWENGDVVFCNENKNPISSASRFDAAHSDNRCLFSKLLKLSYRVLSYRRGGFFSAFFRYLTQDTCKARRFLLCNHSIVN
ncbi:hypothetical protein PUN28_019623 [Cardiocondyla obscurior]|uniref:Uncharacterized protein n=1 Tax=Cardiocondyla obscurior TaxID=286306 RepID=A0AAW2E9M1_9HYME